MQRMSRTVHQVHEVLPRLHVQLPDSQAAPFAKKRQRSAFSLSLSLSLLVVSGKRA